MSGSVTPAMSYSQIAQMVAQGLLPPSALTSQTPTAGTPQQPVGLGAVGLSSVLNGNGGNGQQQAANNGAPAQTLGLPGRGGWATTALGSVAGHFLPGVGTLMGLGNAANGAITADKQLAMIQGGTGVPISGPAQLMGAAAGATGLSGLSAYGGGMGGYGNIGQGGLVGARNMTDPGVDGLARAMGADQADAGAQAASMPATNNLPDIRAAAAAGAAGGYAAGYGGGYAGGQSPGDAQSEANAADEGGAAFAIGGVIRSTGGDYFARKMARGSGLVKAVSPGRADAVHTHVPRGGYVVPADVVSGLGQGNTIAGARRITRTIKTAGSFRNGGQVESVPVRLSGGEFYIHPHHLAAIGRGSLERGSAMMDGVVAQTRHANAHRALTAPPPR